MVYKDSAFSWLIVFVSESSPPDTSSQSDWNRLTLEGWDPGKEETREGTTDSVLGKDKCWFNIIIVEFYAKNTVDTLSSTVFTVKPLPSIVESE